MGRLASLIYKTLEETNREFVPQAHYPSSASFKYADGTTIGPDILSQYLKHTGVRPSNPPDGPSLLRMRLGDGAHTTIADALGKANVKACPEAKFKNAVPGLRLPISGRVDNLIELDGELEVIEVKSTGDQAMFGKGWGIESKGPKEDHQLQLICYLQNIPGLKRGRFLYVGRESGAMLEFVMERSGDTYAINGKPVKELSWAGIVARWAELENLVEAKTPPPPDYRPWLKKEGGIQAIKTIRGVASKTPWRVEYDPFRDHIWLDPANFKYSRNAAAGLKPGE